jgi:hypothetical protein
VEAESTLLALRDMLLKRPNHGRVWMTETAVALKDRVYIYMNLSKEEDHEVHDTTIHGVRIYIVARPEFDPPMNPLRE